MTGLRHRSPPFWHRLFAGLGVALVLALGVFGANADLHGALHDHPEAAAPTAAEHDDGCAVVLFAGGATVPVDVPRSVPAPSSRVEAVLGFEATVRVGGRDVRLPPGQAPPAA